MVNAKAQASKLRETTAPSELRPPISTPALQKPHASSRLLRSGSMAAQLRTVRPSQRRSSTRIVARFHSFSMKPRNLKKMMIPDMCSFQLAKPIYPSKSRATAGGMSVAAHLSPLMQASAMSGHSCIMCLRCGSYSALL